MLACGLYSSGVDPGVKLPSYDVLLVVFLINTRYLSSSSSGYCCIIMSVFVVMIKIHNLNIVEDLQIKFLIQCTGYNLSEH